MRSKTTWEWVRQKTVIDPCEGSLEVRHSIPQHVLLQKPKRNDRYRRTRKKSAAHSSKKNRLGPFNSPSMKPLCLSPKSLARTWSWRRDLNPRPSDYKSDALPAELRQQSTPTHRERSTPLLFICPLTDTSPWVGTKQISYHTQRFFVNNNFGGPTGSSGFTCRGLLTLLPATLPDGFIHQDTGCH
jgi:hypothetical protein